MKTTKILLLLFCLILIGSSVTSCTEEEIQPTNTDGVWKEGNISGQDDWEKHNS